MNINRILLTLLTLDIVLKYLKANQQL